MTFRNGRKPTESDRLTLLDEQREVVSHFTYLGITLQTTIKSYRLHMQHKVSAAIRATFRINHLQQLSTETAMTLFRTVITPIATYGINVIWDKHTNRDLALLETVKSRYMKRVLGIGKTAPSRMTYLLMKETFFIVDIRQQLLLSNIRAYETTLQGLQEKKNNICSEFYATEAMCSREWTQPNYEMRHILTRYSVHGFHHKVCSMKIFHEPNHECKFTLCNGPCERYHVEKCTYRHLSLNKFCSD